MLCIKDNKLRIDNGDLAVQAKELSALCITIHGPLGSAAKTRLPLFTSKVPAGFQSPADDYIDQRLSLDDLVIKNPTSSYIVQAKGHSMTGAGIFDQCYLVVDRSLSPQHNDIVIVSINNDYTVKRLKKTSAGRMLLCAENPEFPDIVLTDELDNICWGVVTCILNPLRK